jgi:hypothetical protein
VDAHPVAAGGTFGFATTNGSGSFTIAGLTTGSYRIRFHLTGFATEWYNDQRTWTAATFVAVAAPATTLLSPIVLSSSAGGISGTVTLGGGVPVPAGVSVDVFEQNGASSTDYVDSFPVTASTGTYNTRSEGGCRETCARSATGACSGGPDTWTLPPVRSPGPASGAPRESAARPTGGWRETFVG